MEGAPLPETLDTIELDGRSLRDWHEWLTTDPKTGVDLGHLRVPCSRYGSDGSECAWWAIACEVVYVEHCGTDHDTEEALDYYQSLVVNDSRDVGELVLTNLTAVPLDLRAKLDIEGAVS